jgi:hypothetical protein
MLIEDFDEAGIALLFAVDGLDHKTVVTKTSKKTVVWTCSSIQSTDDLSLD